MDTSKNLVQVYTCKCNPNFNYKTKSSFSNHFQSKRHLSFQQNIDRTEDRLKIQTLEKEIRRLNSEVKLWKEKYLELDLLRTNTIDLLA
jgi:transposase-like protein